ncbi:hypothetical protein [uncultured Roseobacter sp.]|uniref:hypothetical protein n=1 Tax=uncultured Roseobacter sp. TaxID=114847 RepID=UPI0026106FCB|nr:hypothetical protein [uncultured Roseobacter sp.]
MKSGTSVFLDNAKRAIHRLIAFASSMYGLVVLLIVIAFRSIFEASVSVSIVVALATAWLARTAALYLRNYFSSKPIFQTHSQLGSLRSRLFLWAVVMITGVPIYLSLERSRISTGLSPVQQVHLFLCEAMPKVTPGSDLCSAYAETRLAARQRLAVEEAERKKLAAEEAERQKLAAEEAERQRLAAEEAERQRLAVEEAERKKLAAEEAERKKLAAEEAERQKLAAEEAERQKLAAEEAERQKLAAEEAERQRLAAGEKLSDLDFQRELDRLGCLPGPLDGEWGRRTSAALARVASVLDEPLADYQRNANLLNILKTTKDNACKELCKPNETLTERGCVAPARRNAPQNKDCIEIWESVSCAE